MPFIYTREWNTTSPSDLMSDSELSVSPITSILSDLFPSYQEEEDNNADSATTNTATTNTIESTETAADPNITTTTIMSNATITVNNDTTSYPMNNYMSCIPILDTASSFHQDNFTEKDFLRFKDLYYNSSVLLGDKSSKS